MRLKIKSSLALRSAIAHFGPFDSYAVTGKDIDVFKLEHCEVCAAPVKGANPIVIPNAAKWVHQWFKDSKLMEQPDNLDEITCDDEGNGVCESCWQEGETNKAMLKSEAGLS